MFSGKTIFVQIVELIHPQQFRRCVESLRDIEDCLTARPDQLYHLGFRSRVCHSTLADANEARDWRIYADLATLLIQKARRLYAGQPLEVDLQQSVYALDSTTIELCLTLFPWAHFQATQAAIKLLRKCLSISYLRQPNPRTMIQ